MSGLKREEEEKYTERERATALHHAQQIQQRKDVESQILTVTETLLDLPSLPSPSSSFSSPPPDATHPSLSDLATVSEALTLFQPADFDQLVQERNIDRRCGYVFCPKPNRQQETTAKYRIVHGGGRKEGKVSANTLQFVERQSLEKWCSDECGKRAMFLRGQLQHEPAWTRDFETSNGASMDSDDKNGKEENLARVSDKSIKSNPDTLQKSAVDAIETKSLAFRPKPPTSLPKNSAGAVEGHEPRFG